MLYFASQKLSWRQKADIELGKTREQLMGVINTVLEKEYYLLLSKVDEVIHIGLVVCGGDNRLPALCQQSWSITVSFFV